MATQPILILNQIIFKKDLVYITVWQILHQNNFLQSQLMFKKAIQMKNWQYIYFDYFNSTKRRKATLLLDK